MGFFDIFRRKPAEPDIDAAETPPPTPPPASASAQPTSTFLRVSEDEWDDWDDDAKMQWCMRQFEIIKREYGGEGKLRRNTSDETIALRTSFETRPVSIEVDYTTGWVTLKMKGINRLGHVSLSYNEDTKVGHSDSDQDDDEWEEQGGGQITHVFADGVYLEEYEVEARPMIALVDGLPAELRQAIFHALQQRFIGRILIDAEVMEVSLKQDFNQLRDPKAECDRAFALLYAIGQVFSVGKNELGAKPRVYIGGKPVFSQMPERTKCQYCSTPYSAGDDPRCPSCGAANG